MLHDCGHPETELRRMMTKAGTIQVKRQCVVCGRSTSNAVPQNGLNIEMLPAWDHELNAARIAAHGSSRTQVPKDFFKWYDAYLQTPEWKDKRAAVLARSPICQGCGDQPSAQAHHLTYAHVGNEFLWELVGICLACHSQIHP